MDKINNILIHTVVQQLVFLPPAKRAIALIMFSNIQTSKYRVCQVSVAVDLNLFQNWTDHALDSSRRQHITFHVTEGGEIIITLLLE